MAEHDNPIRLLSPPEYTDEERQALVGFVLSLRKSHIHDFLRQVELPVSGAKVELRERLQEALDEGDLAYEHLVAFLDSVAPWGKQHVFLYDGPRGDIEAWRDAAHVLDLLKRHRTGKLFNARLPLILPEVITLSSVTHADGRLRITAVQKRDYQDRAEEHDEEREIENGERITLRAYVHRVTRTLVAFEWDLNTNAAMLQITQLHQDGDYAKVAVQFFKLVSHWLDIKQFGAVDLRPAIRKLHEIEENGLAETRSHGIHYTSPRGRRISAHSPTPRDSVLGEEFIDTAMEGVRKKGVGHLGNFYWLKTFKPKSVTNPLSSDVHMIVVAGKSRINLPTPNNEEVVRYVLHRVRNLSGSTS